MWVTREIMASLNKVLKIGSKIMGLTWCWLYQEVFFTCKTTSHCGNKALKITIFSYLADHIKFT